MQHSNYLTKDKSLTEATIKIQLRKTEGHKVRLKEVWMKGEIHNREKKYISHDKFSKILWGEF